MTTSNKILGPEVSYCDLLDHEIVEKMKSDQKSRGFPLRPSAAGYCAKRLAFDLNEHLGFATYPKEEMKPELYRLLNLGHSVEYSALKNLELLPGFSLRYKQQMVSMFRLDPAPGETVGRLIEGSMDAVLWSDQYKALIDIKSAKDGFSMAYKTRWDETLDKFNQMKSLVRIGEGNGWYADDVEAFITELNGDFLVDNLVQLNLYACSDFLRERGIDHAVVYKYGKNDSRHYEIRFRPSMALFEKTRQKFNAVYKAITSGAGPETIKCESYLGSFRCAYCPYKSQCHPGSDPTKAWYANFPKKKWPVDLDADSELGALFEQYEGAALVSKEQEVLETKICSLLADEEINKIKLANGHIYEVKLLKTPRPHFELRRSKL